MNLIYEQVYTSPIMLMFYCLLIYCKHAISLYFVQIGVVALALPFACDFALPYSLFSYMKHTTKPIEMRLEFSVSRLMQGFGIAGWMIFLREPVFERRISRDTIDLKILQCFALSGFPLSYM